MHLVDFLIKYLCFVDMFTHTLNKLDSDGFISPDYIVFQVRMQAAPLPGMFFSAMIRVVNLIRGNLGLLVSSQGATSISAAAYSIHSLDK